MEWIEKSVARFSKLLNVVAGCALTFMMLLTVTDVIMRSFRRPIVGTYEMVYFAGAVVIGFAIPMTTLAKGHVLVDFLLMKFSHGVRRVFQLVTRLMGIALFSLAGWNLIKMGFDFLRTGEVSLTLQMPVYPVAFGIGFACLAQCLVLTLQALQVIGGTYE